MKTFLFCILNCIVGMLFSQSELQILEQSQQQKILLAKKQAAFSGHMVNSGTVVTYIEPIVSSDEAKLIEEKIVNYRKNSGQVTLIANDEFSESAISVKSDRIPLSEFSTFPINVQKYITSNRDFYESYIKFD